MSTQRLTVTLPEQLHNKLTKNIPTGKVSSFVATAVEKELLNRKEDPINYFIQLSKKLPKVEHSTIMDAIEKGRE